MLRAMFMPMALTPKMVIIAVVGVFLAGLVDGIAGGGGLISVPAYLIAGLPTHLALGTNKLSSVVGTAVSAGRFIRGGYIDWKLGLPSVALAIFGAHLGTKLQLAVDERWLKWLLDDIGGGTGQHLVGTGFRVRGRGSLRTERLDADCQGSEVLGDVRRNGD